MSYLHECLIYHKFGDCGWMILEYLAGYQIAKHKTKFSPVLAELKRNTERVLAALIDNYTFPNLPYHIYDFCNRYPVMWKYKYLYSPLLGHHIWEFTTKI